MMPEPPVASSVTTLLAVFMFVLRFFLDKTFSRAIGRFQHREHWSVALLRSEHWQIPNNVPLRKFVVCPDDGRRCYADPFLFSQNGRNWLFVEELDYETGRGIISCAEVTDGAAISRPRPVLTRPYHLSYPFVFRHGDEIYMMPETGENRTVELYRARSFPYDWELFRVLIEDAGIYDATLLHHRDMWWIFAAVSHEGGSSQDELGIFYSDQLLGPWRPHVLNPVKSDCHSLDRRAYSL